MSAPVPQQPQQVPQQQISPQQLAAMQAQAQAQAQALQKNPSIVAIATLMRRHPLLKQRQGIYQGSKVEFFRYKRFLRALNSPEYAKKSAKDATLFPAMENGRDREFFVALIKARMVIPCEKLHTKEARERSLVPQRDAPTLVSSNKASLSGDEYYMWNFSPKSAMDYVYGAGIVLGILAVVFYPLWPVVMRKGVYYLSLGMLGLIGLFFVMALIRLIIYCITAPMCERGFWLFPNLFEDCGFFDSFKPLYGWGEDGNYSAIKKAKRKSKKAKAAAESAAASSAAEVTAKPAAKIEAVPESSETTTSGAATSKSSVKKRVVLEDVDE